MPLTLGTLRTEDLTIGKCAAFYSAPAWDFDSNLHEDLTFLGYTEGPVRLVFNETYNALTTPEYTGDAQRKAFVQGQGPVATLPLYLAKPETRAIVSPTGSASGGFRRQRPVATRSLVLIPEELFLDLNDPDLQTELSLEPNGSDWELGGDPLTTAQQRLLGLSAWLWKGYFRTPELGFNHENAGKDVEPAEFVVMQHDDAPNGQQLFTRGDPYLSGIDILEGIIPES